MKLRYVFKIKKKDEESFKMYNHTLQNDVYKGQIWNKI